MFRSLATRYAGRLLGTSHLRSQSKILVITRNNHDQTTWLEDNLKLKVDEGSDKTYVEAIPTNTGREGKVLKSDPGCCTLCRLNLRNLQYTDVMILSQYIKRNGQLVTYHESKLCTSQYRKIIRLIKQAQRCNLIQRPADYLSPGPWHDLNTYLEPDRKRDQPMKVVKPEYWKI